MEFTIILVGVILVAVIVFVAIHKYQNFANNKVEELSIKIKKLKELNSKIEFHKINEKVYIYKHYDNKGHFNRIEPAYLFSAELKNNIEKYSQYIQKIQDNRRNEIIYNERVKEILTKVYDIDYAAAEMSEKEFKKIEDKLFNALLSYKYTKCVVEVFMTYSSPKGRVSLSKEARFTFDDMLVSFNSISRSRLDYKTYSNLAKVERGNVSDSLRYDILNRDHFRCSICGASAKEGVRLHVDHIIPIAKGGKSVPENLRTLCERCNIGKSDKSRPDLTTYIKNTINKKRQGFTHLSFFVAIFIFKASLLREVAYEGSLEYDGRSLLKIFLQALLQSYLYTNIHRQSYHQPDC